MAIKLHGPYHLSRRQLTIVDCVNFCTTANSIDDFHQLRRRSVYRYRCFHQLTLKNCKFLNSNLHFSVLIYLYIDVKHVNTNFLASGMWWYIILIEAMFWLMILKTTVGDCDYAVEACALIYSYNMSKMYTTNF